MHGPVGQGTGATEAGIVRQDSRRRSGSGRSRGVGAASMTPAGRPVRRCGLASPERRVGKPDGCGDLPWQGAIARRPRRRAATAPLSIPLLDQVAVWIHNKRQENRAPSPSPTGNDPPAIGHSIPPTPGGCNVTSRRRTERRGLRFLGIGMLILSTIRVPLPQADYHNVRHHDAPGEVCVYHDHLLRWHPWANSAADVAMLHWHWVAPLVEPGAGKQGGDPGHGPALHAHLGDWPAPDWTGTPLVRPDTRGRLVRPVESRPQRVEFPGRLGPTAPYRPRTALLDRLDSRRCRRSAHGDPRPVLPLELLSDLSRDCPPWRGPPSLPSPGAGEVVGS